MSNKTKKNTNFTLPKHGTAEECVDEYEEEVLPSGEIIRHDVIPSNSDEKELVPLDPTNPMGKMSFADACKIQTHFNAQGRKVTSMKARKSAWVHNIVRLNGEKFDFTGREYLMPIYDTQDKEVLLCTARQVEKSTFLGNNLSVMCSIMPFFKCLYVSPSHAQTRQFSNEKLKTVIEGSPLIRKYLQDSRVSSQVFEKSFTNGSFIFLRSAFLSADRCLPEYSEILFPDGSTKKLHDVQVGDLVLSFHNNKQVTNRVIGKINTGIQQLTKYKLANGFELESTCNHKHITSSGLKTTAQLQIGDHIPVPVESPDFLWVPIVEIEKTTLQITYDLEIENSHTFIANGCVTHNSRGISADLLCLDEMQDLLISNIPVISQCLSHSKYGYHLYTGTPKTFDNTIQIYWETSTMNEWMVPCSSCSAETGRKWNFLDTKNIGKTGPICKYCGKALDVTRGQWQRAKNSRLKGYRIPQLMVPWIAGSEDQWDKLLYNFENYPESQFYNEVLGLSYDNASKPITRADVLGNCQSNLWFIEPSAMSGRDTKLARKMTLFAGVDWGEGNDGTGTDIMGKIKTASYTVLTIGGYVGEKKFRIVYMKRYTGKEVDPEFVVTDIIKTCKSLGVKMIGVDWGHGWGVNNKLFRLYGPQRCVQFMYVDKQKEVRKWDPIGYKVQLMRNHVMSEIFYQFKEGKFLFPSLEHWEGFAKDMFNISVEYIEYRRTIRYVHRPSDPDDWFHSLLYCKQAAEMYYGKYTSQ